MDNAGHDADCISGNDKEQVRSLFYESGAVAVGFAEATTVEKDVSENYNDWISRGFHAGMSYMERHSEVRDDPRLLITGGMTVVSMAFSFKPATFRSPELPYIAAYAYGDDYHDVLRHRIEPCATKLEKIYGAQTRICVDSAPIHERYWARKAGIGEICRNGSLYVPGHGSEVFLAEAIITLPVKADNAYPWNPSSCEEGCDNCGACHLKCPGNALNADGSVDARRCLSYLTIEHRGPWDATQKELSDKAGVNLLFGCDLCLRACHLNNHTPSTAIPEFSLRETFANLTKPRCMEIRQEEFSRIFKGSAVKRCKLSGFLRNIGAPDTF